MRKCLNCQSDMRTTDIYCRNCGCALQSNKNFIFINIITIIVIIGIIFMFALFIASYLITK